MRTLVENHRQIQCVLGNKSGSLVLVSFHGAMRLSTIKLCYRQTYQPISRTQQNKAGFGLPLAQEQPLSPSMSFADRAVEFDCPDGDMPPHTIKIELDIKP